MEQVEKILIIDGTNYLPIYGENHDPVAIGKNGVLLKQMQSALEPLLGHYHVDIIVMHNFRFLSMNRSDALNFIAVPNNSRENFWDEIDQAPLDEKDFLRFHANDIDWIDKADLIICDKKNGIFENSIVSDAKTFCFDLNELVKNPEQKLQQVIRLGNIVLGINSMALRILQTADQNFYEYLKTVTVSTFGEENRDAAFNNYIENAIYFTKMHILQRFLVNVEQNIYAGYFDESDYRLLQAYYQILLADCINDDSRVALFDMKKIEV